MSQLRTVGLLVVLLSLVSPLVARAETDDELARHYYKLGRELFARSAYAEALTSFKKSYDYSQKPGLLFNMARCHESLGQPAKAIELYERYLKSKSGDERTTALVKIRIKHLRQQSAAGEPTPKPKPTPEPTPEPQPEPEPDAGSEPTAAPGQPLRTAGWITLGVGGAALITGIVMGALAQSKSSDLEQANTEGREYSEVMDQVDAGEALQAGQIASLVIGGVAAAAGAVLLYLGHRGAEEQAAYLRPGILPGGAAVTCGLRF